MVVVSSPVAVAESDIDRKESNKQRNPCVSLIRREKKNFFNNISTRYITDNKTFWKTVKPLFADNVQAKSKITRIEKKVVSGEGQKKKNLKNTYQSQV